MNKMMRMFLVGTTVFSLAAHVNVNAMLLDPVDTVDIVDTVDKETGEPVVHVIDNGKAEEAPEETLVNPTEMDAAEKAQEKNKQNKSRSRLALMTLVAGTTLAAVAADCYYNEGKLTKRFVINPAQKYIATPAKNARAYIWNNLPTITNWFGKAKKVAETVAETVETVAAKAVESTESAPITQSWFSSLTNPAYNLAATVTKPAYNLAATVTKPAYNLAATVTQSAYDFVAQQGGRTLYNNALAPMYNFASRLASKAVEAATEETAQELATQLTEVVAPAFTAESVEAALSTLVL